MAKIALYLVLIIDLIALLLMLVVLHEVQQIRSTSLFFP